MIDAKSAGRPLLHWRPASVDRCRPVPVIGAVAVGAALLALLPLLSLIVIAFGETGDLWAHLARYVIPTAFVRTTLLLAGVAAVTIILGAGTAWIVTTFAFPGRDT